MSDTKNKILMLSIDRKIFDADSLVQKRMIELGKEFEEMHIVVYTPQGFLKQQLSDNVFVYPTNSKKRFLYFFDAFSIGSRILKDDSGSFFMDSQDGMTNVAAVFLKIVNRVPLHIQIHTDFKNKYFLEHSFTNYLRSVGYTMGIFFADSVRVVSERIKRSLGKSSKKAYILPVAIQNVDTSEGIEVKEKYPGFEKFVLLAQRLESEKDTATALRVFAASTETTEKVALIVLGDGRELSSLKELSAKLNIDERVFFEGWQSPEPYLASVDVFLQTSLYEGYGVSVIEAGLAKLPIVSTDVGAMGEVFVQEESALICTQKDVLCLTKALARVLADDPAILSLGENAYKAVQTHLEKSIKMYQPLFS